MYVTSVVPGLLNVPEKDHAPEASGLQLTLLRASVAKAEGTGTPVAVVGGAGCGAVLETVGLAGMDDGGVAGGLVAGGLQAAKASKPTAHPPMSGVHLSIFPPK